MPALAVESKAPADVVFDSIIASSLHLGAVGQDEVDIAVQHQLAVAGEVATAVLVRRQRHVPRVYTVHAQIRLRAAEDISLRAVVVGLRGGAIEVVVQIAVGIDIGNSRLGQPEFHLGSVTLAHKPRAGAHHGRTIGYVGENLVGVDGSARLRVAGGVSDVRTVAAGQRGEVIAIVLNGYFLRGRPADAVGKA